MKKRILLAAVLIAAFTFSSCTPEKGTDGTTGPTGANGTPILVMQFQDGAFPAVSYTGCEDSRIWDASPTSNYGSYIGNYVGAEYGEKKRLFIKYDVSSLPAGAVIKKAYIRLNHGVLYGAPKFAFHKVTAAWIEAQVTWNNRLTATAWSPYGGEYEAAAASDIVTVSSANSSNTWTIQPSVVQAWYDSSATNYGLELIETTEAATGMIEAEIYLSEYGTPEERPMLTVYYTLN